MPAHGGSKDIKYKGDTTKNSEFILIDFLIPVELLPYKWFAVLSNNYNNQIVKLHVTF